MLAVFLTVLIPFPALAGSPTVDELKNKLSSASSADRPHLCIQIAQLQLTESDKAYAASEFDKARAALTDVVAYAELARNYAIQSHKHEKQSEIAVREMARKLSDLVHTLPREEQEPVQDAVVRLQRVRDELLSAMFPKKAK